MLTFWRKDETFSVLVFRVPMTCTSRARTIAEAAHVGEGTFGVIPGTDTFALRPCALLARVDSVVQALRRCYESPRNVEMKLYRFTSFSSGDAVVI